MPSYAGNIKLIRLANSIFLLTLALSLLGCAESKSEKVQYMFWPPAPDTPHVQFLTSISSSSDVTEKQTKVEDFLYGADPSRGLPFFRPYGIRIVDGKLFVCDASVGNLSVLDFRKKTVEILGTTGAMHLAKPIDLAVAPEGSKYVADTAHGAVLVFDAEGKYAGKVTVKDMRPVSVAVFENRLYISDIAASVVRVFDRFNGKELQIIGAKGGGEGKFGGAMGLCLDKDGNVYVNDVIGCRVQKFSPDGKFLWSIGGLGDRPGQLVRPKMMAVDTAGILYVVDNAFQNVQMFDPQGKTLMFFGGSGTHPGAMNSPAGVCVSNSASDLELFASYVHPAFQAQRLIFVTNQSSLKKINVYALGELKPGKTVADISPTRVQGIFGFDTGTPVDVLALPNDATEPAAGAATQSAAPAATQPASAPATAPAQQAQPSEQPEGF